MPAPIELEKIDISSPKLIIHGEEMKSVKVEQKEYDREFEIRIYLPSQLNAELFKFYPKGNDFFIAYNNAVIYQGAFIKHIKVTYDSIRSSYSESGNFITIIGDLFAYDPRIIKI